MTTPIQPPNVKVTVKNVTTTQRTYAPQLPACVVGPCRSILPLTDSSGSPNSGAKVSIPATILGTDQQSTKNVAGLTLKISVDGDAPQSYQFPSYASPTQFAISSALIASLIDQNISGLSAKSVENQIRLTTVLKGDGASIKLLKSDLRIKYLTGGVAPSVGDTVKIGAIGLGTVLSVDPTNRYLVLSWFESADYPVAGSTLVNVAGNVTIGNIDSVTCVAAQLGMITLLNVGIEGANNYRNQDIAIPLQSLPADFGTTSKMVFDSNKVSLYRSQNGVLKLFSPTSSTLRYRKERHSTTTEVAELLVGVGGRGDNTAIILRSVPGVVGSRVSISFDSGADNVTVSDNYIAVTCNTTTGTTGDIANLINSSNAAGSLITAIACGDGLGTGIGTLSETHLSPFAYNYCPRAEANLIGRGSDDGDSDSVTPYFCTAGKSATLILENLTFTAVGFSGGDYCGQYGNDLTIKLVDDGAESVSVVVGGGTINITINFNGGTTTWNGIADLVAQKLAKYVTCTVTAVDGEGLAAESAKARLTGGVDPYDFLSTPTKARVVGERTNYNFGLRKIVFTGLENGIYIGDSIEVNGNVVGTIIEYHAGTSTIFCTVGSYAPKAGEEASYTNGVATVTTFKVSSFVEAGVANGDTLTLRFDTFGSDDADVSHSQVGQAITVVFEATTDLDGVVGAINTAVNSVYAGADVASLANADSTSAAVGDHTAVLAVNLENISCRKGLESFVVIGGTAAEKVFGLQPGGSTFSGIHEGLPYAVAVGDDIYNGSTRLGRVVAIEDLKVGAQTFPNARLRISTDTLSLTKEYTQWWVLARNITLSAGKPVAVNGYDRPLPAAVVDTTLSTIFVTQNQARAIDGSPLTNPSYPLYVSYNALRTDLAAPLTKSLTAIDSAADITAKLGEITPENPLAYAAYRAVVAAPSLRIYALGVSDDSDVNNTGTYAAYQEAIEFLKTQDVYAIVPLTHDASVHKLVIDHCDEAGDPSGDIQRARIGIVSAAMPVEKSPSLVLSGTATLDDVNTITLDDSVNLEEALTEAGVDPNGSWADFKTAGFYLKLTTTPGKFSVLSVIGNTVVVANTGFDPGENDDLFYATTELNPDSSPAPVNPNGETVRLYLRGAVIDTSAKTGKDSQAQALADAAQELKSERCRFVQPDQFEADVPNYENATVPGYFAAAAIAGLITGKPAYQSLSSMAVPGLKNAVGSDDKFTPGQLNLAAGGGVFWLVNKDGSVVVRHQLTTDLTDEKTKQCSLVRIKDFIVRFFKGRLAFKGDGSQNIDNNFLTGVSLEAEAGMQLLVRNKYVVSGSITSVTQDAEKPTRVIVEGRFKPPYPCDEIDFTLYSE